MAHFSPDDAEAIQQAVQAHLGNFMREWFGAAANEAPDTAEALAEALASKIDFVPDEEQQQLLVALATYLVDADAGQAFILKGSAGTGKTSLMQALVSQLRSTSTPIYLLAPTGRAAKVLAQRTGKEASTIHKQIYMLEERLDAGGKINGFSFMLRDFETEEPAVFVVDEASMLGSMPSREGLMRTNGLLDDLLRYVFSNSGWNRLIFVGDPFQLPPVQELRSAALTASDLAFRGIQSFEFTLREVKRQQRYSGILQMATQLRDQLEQKRMFDAATFELPEDIGQIHSVDAALELYLDLYKQDPDQVTLVTYSNFWAQRINKKFRRLLHGSEQAMPVPGESMLVIRNHYLNKSDFIANGEEIDLISHQGELEDYAGLQWLKAEYAFVDLKGRRHIRHGRVLFDLLNSKEAGLSQPAYQMLLIARKHAETYGPFDPYLNALQLKYPYAITTHKAQGGEWKHVFVLMEKAYGSDELFQRWLYTAITRASGNLYLVAPQ